MFTFRRNEEDKKRNNDRRKKRNVSFSPAAYCLPVRRSSGSYLRPCQNKPTSSLQCMRNRTVSHTFRSFNRSILQFLFFYCKKRVYENIGTYVKGWSFTIVYSGTTSLVAKIDRFQENICIYLSTLNPNFPKQTVLYSIKP